MKPIYYHISNPLYSIAPGWLYTAWERLLCRRGLHLFDQDLSRVYNTPGRFKIKCDACGYLATIDRKEWDDFDPDALIQNLIVGMLGYHTEDGYSRLSQPTGSAGEGE